MCSRKRISHASVTSVGSRRSDIHGALKNVFGFSSFRPYQEEIVKRIMNGGDVFAVMPTGGGKSLCYQLPATVMDGVAVVISPLISLMKDQIDAARGNGIQAAFLNSSLSRTEKTEVFGSLRSNSLDLLYIAPERFVTDRFQEILREIPVSLFAIDEAHCISEWGHDFRPDYLGLSLIPERYPGVPVAAFTATATRRVQDDIIGKIGLHSPLVVRASFDRPGLFYEVKRKSAVDGQILEFVKRRRAEPGIVYRTTRDSVIKTARFLEDNGVKALPYHAGMTAEDRRVNQEAFNRDAIDVIVATIAFGMGIDKSNVRYVIHGDLPKNLESYYQETGRAGRDGEPAHCLLFFSTGDIPKVRFFLDRIEDGEERAAARDKFWATVKYASHNLCRRVQLLEYFEEEYPQESCNNCDVCLGQVDRVDSTDEARMVLSAIEGTGQRFGIGHVIDVVAGATTGRIRALGHHRIGAYGAGGHREKKYWRFMIDELLVRRMVRQEGRRYPVLKITGNGKSLLRGDEHFFTLEREERKEPERKPGRNDKGEGCDTNLFERLRKLRKRLAKNQKVPPFVVFSDRTLREMCRIFPASYEEMIDISGVGEVKLNRYGDIFITEIQEYRKNCKSLIGD